MAVNGRGFMNDFQDLSLTSESLAESKPDELTLPTEDFLASIGLKPRNSEDTYQHRSAMPAGWRRVLIQRKVGRTAGKFDVYIYSPEGRKFRSKTELEAHIKKCNLNVSVSDFCFTVRGQHMLDLAASHDGNGKWHKRKQNSTHDAPIDGKLGVTSSCEVDNGPPRRKRMKLWEGPSMKSTKNDSDTLVDSVVKESKKTVHKNKLLNSHLQPVKQTVVHRKDKDLLMKSVVKSSNTKPRRVSRKLTVQMKFMPSVSKGLKADCSQSELSGQSQVAGSATDDSASVLTSNGGLSPTFSTCKIVSGQNSLHHKKHVVKQQAECFTVIRPLVSSVKSSASNRRRDLILPQEHIANGDESSADMQWIPPQSPFNLVEESLFHSSWKILIASILLESGQDELQRKALSEFLHTWSSVESALGATWQQIHKRLQPYGITADTVKTLLQFCEEYLTKNWCYPRELHGIKKYGDDAYRIFCINEWKQVAPDNPKLNEYHRWLWANHRVLGIH